MSPRSKSKTSKRKTAKKTTRKAKKPQIPVEQGKTRARDAGYGRPPKEHQVKPGQSGNPHGQPKHRVNLWVHLCRYAELTEHEIAELHKPEQQRQLTQSQRAALALLQKLVAGNVRLAIQIFDREEGRPLERMHIERDEPQITDAERETIRKMFARRMQS